MNKIEFKEGLRDGIPICLGYFSVSIALGLSAVKMGIPVWLVTLMSVTNLTSAGEFAGIAILASCGSYLELIASMLIINARYFLMSLSVSQKVGKDFTLGKRLMASYGITDEVFAVSMQRKTSLSFPYMVGLISTPVVGWTLGTLTGAVASTLLPAVLSDAMGIALYGMFIAIIVPPAKEQKSVLIAVLLAIAASYVITYIPGLSDLLGGWSVIIITVVVSGITASLFPVKEEEGA